MLLKYEIHLKNIKIYLSKLYVCNKLHAKTSCLLIVLTVGTLLTMSCVYAAVFV